MDGITVGTCHSPFVQTTEAAAPGPEGNRELGVLDVPVGFASCASVPFCGGVDNGAGGAWEISVPSPPG